MKKIYKYLTLFLSIFISLSVIPTFSSFIEERGQTTITDPANELAINVEYYVKNDGSWIDYPDGVVEAVPGTLVNLEGSTKLSDVYRNYYNKYNVGDEFDHREEESGNYIYDVFYVCTAKSTSGSIITTYHFSYETRRKIIKIKGSTYDLEKSKTFYISRNSSFNADLLETNYYYFTDKTFKTRFDFGKNINTATTIFGVRYINESNSDLSDFLTNTHGTVSVYDGNLGGSSGSGSNYNVATDPKYFGNNVFLDETITPSDSNISFLLGSGNTGNNPEGELGTSDDYNLNHKTNDGTLNLSNNSPVLKVVLNGDLTINGTLTLGAQTGNNASDNNQSYINGAYTSIDLNGHNLIINGTLNVYGEIKDSLGTGTIILNNNSKIYALMSFTDGRGGNQTIWGYGKGHVPFTDYRFPYITAKIRCNYGSTFVGYTKLYLGRLGGSAIPFTLLGNNGYISWVGEPSDYILITPYVVDSLSAVAYTNNLFNYRYKIGVYAKLKFNDIGNAVTVAPGEFMGITVKGEVTIQLSRVNFPISSFFDIYLYNYSNIEIPYLAVFYPGSSLYVDNTSSLTFSFINNRVYEDNSVVTKHISGYTADLAGGIVSLNHSLDFYNSFTLTTISVGLYGISAYFNYINTNNIVIEGNINFVDGNEGKYILSGKMLINSTLIDKIISEKSKLQTYHLINNQNYSLWFNTMEQAFEPSNDGISYTRISHYQILPLIVKGHGYIMDYSNNLKGEFIEGSDLIKVNNDYYFLSSDDFMYGTSNSSQDSQISKNVYVNKATAVDLNKNAVFDGTNYYAYYCGAYVKCGGITFDENLFTYGEVTTNLGKYFSNESLAVVSDGTYSAFKLQWNDNSKQWDNKSTMSISG